MELGNGTIVRRHHDQLLARQSSSTEQLLPPQRQSEVQCEDATHGSPQQGRPASEAPVEETELVIELPRRYPVRSRGAPERFEQTIQTFRIIVTCKFFVFFLGNLGRRNVES